ncbi:MAG: DUF1080 domain-containing protein [Planctomycetaceae bacterium]|nr:DUF1080 domain-containing protein [Planctomycetaceae bacterium]
MKRAGALLVIAAILVGCAGSAQKNGDQQWTVLFDGNNMDAWRGLNSQTLPARWMVADGVLVFDPAAQGSGGDIITKDEYKDFEFELEYKISLGTNSGIKYFVVEEMSNGTAGLGLEYQILDDENHKDAKAGIDGNRTMASLYDLIAPNADKSVHPIGQWNTARIVSKGSHVEHWLNGKKVLEYERGSVPFMDLIAASKYKDIKGFGLADKGHILLQDHGNKVFFRNIRVKTPK